MTNTYLYLHSSCCFLPPRYQSHDIDHPTRFTMDPGFLFSQSHSTLSPDTTPSVRSPVVTGTLRPAQITPSIAGTSAAPPRLEPVRRDTSHPTPYLSGTVHIVSCLRRSCLRRSCLRRSCRSGSRRWHLSVGARCPELSG